LRQIDNRQKQKKLNRASRVQKGSRFSAAKGKESTSAPESSGKSSEASSEQATPFHAEAKVGRNEPCPCGSGKKYKKCCLLKS